MKKSFDRKRRDNIKGDTLATRRKARRNVRALKTSFINGK